jgi:hypothetical protein
MYFEKNALVFFNANNASCNLRSRTYLGLTSTCSRVQVPTRCLVIATWGKVM